MKIQVKTLLFLTASYITILAVIFAFITIPLLKNASDNFNLILEAKAREIAGKEIANQNVECVTVLSHTSSFIYKISPDSTLKMQAKNLGLPDLFYQTLLSNGSAELKTEDTFFKGIIYHHLNQNYAVIVEAQKPEHLTHSLYFKRTMLAIVLFSLFFAAAVSLYLSKYIYNPLTKITNRVKEISTENLHLRLHLNKKNDVLDNLADTFNDMLNRIEASFEIQNNFISNASHELRTPLTAIIGEADVSLSKTRKPEEYIDTMKIILEEAEKLDRKTKALLFLAQTGFNGKIVEFTTIRIDQLLWDVKETIQRINANSSIYLDISLMPDDPMKLKIKGNDQLLHLAFSNIINNACKYSNYKQVRVSIGVSNTSVIVVISDQGIGIPEKELSHIYDTFYRASNTKSYEGYGIGLPLTRNIIRMHKGDITVLSQENNGTTVEVKIPGLYTDSKTKVQL